MTPEPFSTTRLRAGEALHVALDAGSTVQVLAGAIRLREPPLWLGETMTVPTTMLGAGEQRRIERSGWVEMAALDASAEIVQHRPASRARAVWRALFNKPEIAWET